MTHTTTSPSETISLAKQLASKLKPGDVIALIGELGAGKTQFVKGLAEGLGVPNANYVRSPTFTLLNEYRGGRLDLFHFDFYRLDKAAELGDLGLDEYIFGNGVTVIEWADRFPGAIPDHAITVDITIVDESVREISCRNLT